MYYDSLEHFPRFNTDQELVSNFTKNFTGGYLLELSKGKLQKMNLKNLPDDLDANSLDIIAESSPML